MANHSHDRAAALLESAGPGTARPARRPAPQRPHVRRPLKARPCVEVSESGDTLIVRVPLCEGPLELRVPRSAVKAPKPLPRHHIEGSNPDATPC
jgi:hypothetical protein